MRGKGNACKIVALSIGITPAHAGKRGCIRIPAGSVWDHPRTCGEKSRASLPTAFSLGSPPHMRGKARQRGGQQPTPGITPAHAGKRFRGIETDYSWGDHPRTCGEKFIIQIGRRRKPGSPPHMRGKDSGSNEI